MNGATSGGTANNVAQNVRRLRGNISLRELSDRLDGVGHPISELALGRIENNKRKVDVDDLTALAVVLQVNPNALLMPNYAGEVPVEVTGSRDATGTEVWDWAEGWKALPSQTAQLEVEAKPGTGERGRQVWAQRHAARGFGFEDLTRPQGERPGLTDFLRRIRAASGRLPKGASLAVWQSGGGRVAEFPRRAYSGAESIPEHLEALSDELVDVLTSKTAEPVLDAVLRRLQESNDGDN